MSLDSSNPRCLCDFTLLSHVPSKYKEFSGDFFLLREKSIALDFMGFIEIGYFLAQREIVRRSLFKILVAVIEQLKIFLNREESSPNK